MLKRPCRGGFESQCAYKECPCTEEWSLGPYKGLESWFAHRERKIRFELGVQASAHTRVKEEGWRS